MTGEASGNGVRPTEEVLRQRLIARRSDYERARGETSLGGRLNRRGTGRHQGPGAEGTAGRHLRDFAGRRPVTAYLSMATVAGLLFGGLALTLSGGSDTAPPVRLADAQQATSSRTDAAAIAPDAADRPGADLAAETASAPPAAALRDEVAAIASPATKAPAETAARLRPASSDLLASTPTAREPVIADEAAAALALRLPPADATLAMQEVPDRLLTTGSILPAEESPVPASGLPPQSAEDGGAAASADMPPEDGLDTSEAPAEAAVADEEVAALDEAAGAPRSATVNASVNMREAADNDATILAVLPRGSAVEIIGCDLWCEVAAAGKRGYVFKRFVDGVDG
jgi:hypothetical protein